MSKPILTTLELIKHMENKGITFNYESIADAQKVLDTRNYYFKLASYRTMFPKGSDGKYANLDFAYLEDLASIDGQLREYLLELTLDIEHGIKTFLISLISSEPNEDGYSIVEEYKKRFSTQYTVTLNQLGHNAYFKDMYRKYHDEMPIWVLMEVISFGTLSQFVEFYFEKYQYKKLKQIKNHLKFCKNIRNACAHSNPFLVNIFSEKEFIPRPSAAIISVADMMNISREYIKDVKINDLVSTFYLHKKFQSSQLKDHRIREGKRLLKRFDRHSTWYAENQKINTFITILRSLVDYLE